MTVACAASDVIHALNLFPSLMWSCPPFLYPAALAIMPDKLETLQSRTELKYRFSRCCLGMISFRMLQMRRREPWRMNWQRQRSCSNMRRKTETSVGSKGIWRRTEEQLGPLVEQELPALCCVQRDIALRLQSVWPLKYKWTQMLGFTTCIWGYQHEHTCTFISDQRLQMNRSDLCPLLVRCHIWDFFLAFIYLYLTENRHSD